MDDLIRRSDAIKSVLSITMLQGRVPIDTVIYQISSIPAVEPNHGKVMAISASECIPIEYIEEQIAEYRKFDHLGMYAEFLYMFIQDYKDNAMANYIVEPKQGEWIADGENARRVSDDYKGDHSSKE